METLYKKIASELAEDIQQGIYVSGQKVPSVRKLSHLKSVSISTINQAYGLLEDQGLIRARPQSGYFVREGANEPIQPPPISKGGIPQAISKSDLISSMLNAVNQPGLLNFGAAIAHDSYMPHKALQAHIQKVTRFQSAQILSYIFSPGYKPLRRQIATRMREVSVKCHQDEVVITQGCSEALSLCLGASTQSGDIVAVESPCYYGFLQQAELRGLKVIEIPTNAQTGVSLDALSLALKKWPIKLIAVTSRYSNPTGAALNTEKQQQLYKLAQQYNLMILEDDIYGELGYSQPINTVLKTFDVDDRVMYCSSFSKTLSPGIRIGWCLPGKALNVVVKTQTFSSFSPSSLSQLALSSFLETGQFDKHLRKLRQTCQYNIETISLSVRQHFPDGTQLTQPKGGYILWVRLPDGMSSMDLQKSALKKGINIAPGALFSNIDEFDQYLRLNCALPMDTGLRHAIKQLGDLAGIINTKNI
jgi:DNA-binding transcriptional MocR family regulator